MSVRNIAEEIDKYHQSKTQDRRFHMGCSLIGHKCERYLWLNFRFAKDEEFPGRILRLFRRGHMEEYTVVDDLQSIGLKVTDYGEEQTKVDLGSHVSGSIDGIVELDGERMILECKTHSDKSFNYLKSNGVEKAQIKHFVQCNVYCFGTGLKKALYYAVNKNTDEIYTEIIDADYELAERYIERAQAIATQDELPPPITTNKSWWECKFCNFHSFCMSGEEITNKNCRTCAYSTAMDDSTWYCEKHLDEIPESTQPHGCSKFSQHDHLIKEK